LVLAYEGDTTMKEDFTSRAVSRVENDLKSRPDNFRDVFDDLSRMRKEDPQEFSRNLDEMNQRLHKDGFLPKLQIVEDEDGLGLAADSKNPQGSAVVRRSNHPHESRRERNDYNRMHYDGWHDSATGGGATPEGHVPQGHRRDLIDRALRIAGMPINSSNEAAVNLIVQNESGWNPNAINLTDSNARAGHPSQGLMQTIPSTFHQYAAHGYDQNINDPLSNLVAGIRYAHARYGSLENVPGVRRVAENRAYVGY
jgi:hypothetical protein